MTCPNCGRKLKLPDAARSRCIHCGRPFDRRALGLVRTSTIRVSAGAKDQVYKSVSDLPPELQQRLQQVINGPDTETVVIADERGREEIFQIIHGLPPDSQKKVLAALEIPPASGGRLAAFRAWREWLLIAGALLLCLLLWWVWK